MHKKLLLSILLLASFSGYAQQFSFRMVFVDFLGNRDTVTLGYDDNATNGIDAALGEQNIAGQPYKPGLDVRASNIWWKKHADAQSFLQGKDAMVDAFINEPAMQAKKQFVKNTNSCILGSVHKGPFWKIIPIIELDVRTENWPVLAYWDSSVFSDPCRNGSVITAMHPGAWWDNFTSLKAELIATDSVEFYRNTYHYTDSGVHIPAYFVAFGDSSLAFDDVEMEWLLSVPHTQQNVRLHIAPNPAADNIAIRASHSFGTVQQVNVYTPSGQLVKATNETTLDVSGWSNGLYFIEVMNERGARAKEKIVVRH